MYYIIYRHAVIKCTEATQCGADALFQLGTELASMVMVILDSSLTLRGGWDRCILGVDPFLTEPTQVLWIFSYCAMDRSSSGRMRESSMKTLLRDLAVVSLC